jgi:Ala-tRNA(Pro) deacylase
MSDITPLGSDAVRRAILDLLAAASVPFREIEHPPLSGDRAAASAATLRGTPLEMGGKALVLKADRGFVVAAFSAARRMDSGRFRKAVGARRLRFATRDELATLTHGLVPGCVPPIGPPVFDLPLIADPSLFEGDELVFTPGRLDRSLVVPTDAWRALTQPQILEFAEPSSG